MNTPACSLRFVLLALALLFGLAQPGFDAIISLISGSAAVHKKPVSEGEAPYIYAGSRAIYRHIHTYLVSETEEDFPVWVHNMCGGLREQERAERKGGRADLPVPQAANEFLP